MFIVCEATGVSLNAATEVADVLIGRGFSPCGTEDATVIEPTITEPPFNASVNLGGSAALQLVEVPQVDDSHEEGSESAVGTIDAGGTSMVSAQDGIGALVPVDEDPLFEGWKVEKEFLKGQEIGDLRAFADSRGIDLPKPANKGQIVNAIVASTQE